jgi:membrane protein DedA with SNARE-associated domain
MQQLNELITWAKNLDPIGLYIFTFIWLFVESTGFPISDEPLLLLVGTLSVSGKINLVLAIFIALIGKVTASCVAYRLGWFIHLEHLARPEKQPSTNIGRWLYRIRPTREAVDIIEARFRKQGAWGVFLGRLIPVVRSFISYPAGTARMPFPIFLTATTAGSFIWITTWTVLGAALGKSAQKVAGPLGLILFASALVLLIGAYIWNHRRQERRMHEMATASNVHQTSNTESSQSTPAKKETLMTQKTLVPQVTPRPSRPSPVIRASQATSYTRRATSQNRQKQ